VVAAEVSDPMLPQPQSYDPDRFYSERDSRTLVGGGIASDLAGPVAVVLNPDVAHVRGAHLALLWACSLLRRMNRAFARSIVIGPAAARDQGFADRRGAPATLVAAIAEELVGADPFGTFEWRDFEPQAFRDIGFAIWIGGRSAAAGLPPPGGEVSIDASGWVVRAGRGAGAAQPAVPQRSMNAAPPALALAAALGVAEVYRAAFRGERDDRHVWYALDSAHASSSAEEGERWFDAGSPLPEPLPWLPGTLSVGLERLAVVSAGGLGWNVAELLGEWGLPLSDVVVVDPDVLEVSNLNRLVASEFGGVGQKKAELVASRLKARGISGRAVTVTYEEWSRSGDHRPYLEPGSAVLIGVDQAISRLEVAADWPDLLVNGATAGQRFTVSAHRPGIAACLGCFYGSARTTFEQALRPVACGAGNGPVDPGSAPVPVASYSFASAAAAAVMVATLVHAAALRAKGDVGARSGEFREMNTLVPDLARALARAKDSGCRLLCSHEYVTAVLNARAAGERGGSRP
jgi:hypothetical protein